MIKKLSLYIAALIISPLASNASSYDPCEVLHNFDRYIWLGYKDVIEHSYDLYITSFIYSDEDLKLVHDIILDNGDWSLDQHKIANLKTTPKVEKLSKYSGENIVVIAYFLASLDSARANDALQKRIGEDRMDSVYNALGQLCWNGETISNRLGISGASVGRFGVDRHQLNSTRSTIELELKNFSKLARTFVLEFDDDEALRFLIDLSLSEENPDGLFEAGRIHNDRKLRFHNQEKAVRLFREAAKLGHKRALKSYYSICRKRYPPLACENT